MPNSWPAPSPGLQDAGVLYGPLTSSPVHHLFGAPLGHGLHGRMLLCPLGWGVDGGVLKLAPAVVPCVSWASAQACMAAVSRPSRSGSARGVRPWVPTYRTATAVQPQFSPRRSRIQLLLRDHRSSGRKVATSDPRPGAAQAWNSPGPELLGRLALRSPCERCPLARSSLRVRRCLEPSRQRVPPPAPPSRAARERKNAEPARSGCKVSAPLAAPGIRAGAGRNGSNTWERAGPSGSNTWEGRGRDDADYNCFPSCIPAGDYPALLLLFKE